MKRKAKTNYVIAAGEGRGKDGLFVYYFNWDFTEREECV